MQPLLRRPRTPHWLTAIALFAGLAGVGAVSGPGATAPASASATAATAPYVRVSGNQIVNGNGQPIRLLGVDRSGTEYACAQGWGIFDGPSDSASIAAIASWNVNAVRVPLNEDCWLGLNGVNPTYSGANYQNAIEGYVGRLNAAGLVAVLDLHWNAPGSQLALSQQISADSDHSPAFWASVASVFRTDPGVVFDLYNEPHDISWDCWRNGCWNAYGWHSAGMQDLLDAVRSTGATQPVLVGGLNWGGDLSQWLQWEPVDPAHQLAASVHIYNFSQCNTSLCWAQSVAPVAAKVPVVTGEIGENDCATGFVDAYMNWADANGISYLAWAWNTSDCSGFPALITSYSGTPTALGAGVQRHLAELATGQVPGGYVVASAGDIQSFATGSGPAPPAVSGTGSPDIRGSVLLPDGTGGYTLDGYGNLHPFAVGSNPLPPAPAVSASWPGWDIARAVAVLPSGTGGYVLDGWGGIHPFAVGSAGMPPAVTATGYTPLHDIARDLVLLPDGAGGYTLDGYGNLHPFAVGSNPLPPAPSVSASWPGWDIARAVAILPSGTGGYVLDGWGGIHPFAVGSAGMPPAVTASSYWAYQDVACSVVLDSLGTGGYVLNRAGMVAPFTTGTAQMPSTPTPVALSNGDAGVGLLLSS